MLTLFAMLLGCSGSMKESDTADECFEQSGEGSLAPYVHSAWDDVCIDDGYVCDWACETLHSITAPSPGPNSRPTCNIYEGSAADDRSADELLPACEQSCLTATGVTDGASTYDSSVQAEVAHGQALVNRADAVVWAQCVNATACEDLSHGWCATAY
jgi:hypothetical protein